MAFALTNFRAYKLGISSATDRYGLQGIEMTVTRTASDVAIDLDTVSGTFWTDILADATYGAYAARITPLWSDLLTKIENISTLQILGDGGKMVSLSGTQTESGTVTAKWAGNSAGTALNADSADQTFSYSIVNGVVNLQIPAYKAAAKGAAPGGVIVLKSTTLLPAALRPATDMRVVIPSVDNNAEVVGTATIKTTGQIELYTGIPSAAAYTVTANAGQGGFQVSYPVVQAAPNSGSVAVVGTFPVVKPSITLAANAAPATLQIFMVCALTSQSNPIEFR
jgi:hypothetical protein